MPSKSKTQQRLMGMVYAYKTGKLDLEDLPKSLANKIKGISDGRKRTTGDKRRKTKGISDEEAKRYASTKHKGLPEKVEERIITKFDKFINEKYDKFGDLKDAKSIEEISKIHNFDLKKLKEYLKVGIRIEREHTDDNEIAEKIALHHLEETPNYYHNKFGLPEMERRLEKMLEEEKEKQRKKEE